MSKLDELGGMDGLKADVENRSKYEVHTVPRLYAEALIEHVEELGRELDSAKKGIQFAYRAIEDAIFHEDGLDGGAGEAALEVLDRSIPGFQAIRSKRVSGKLFLSMWEEMKSKEGQLQAARELAERVKSFWGEDEASDVDIVRQSKAIEAQASEFLKLTSPADSHSQPPQPPGETSKDPQNP